MERLSKAKLREWVGFGVLLALVCIAAYHTFPPGVLVALGLKKTDTIIELSGFGAFLTYSLLGLTLFRFAVVYMFPGWDMKTFRTGSTSNDAQPRIWAAVILALGLIISASITKAEVPPHLAAALRYEHVVEKPAGSNCGPEVNKFLRAVGLGPGYSWCAGYASQCLNEGGATEPGVRSAMARAFITAKSIRAADVLSGRVTVPPGTLVIWQRGTGPLGHVGFVVRQSGPGSFETIEGNTSSGITGSQYNGDGVYRRRRSISLTNHFRITHFTLVGYPPPGRVALRGVVVDARRCMSYKLRKV